MIEPETKIPETVPADLLLSAFVLGQAFSRDVILPKIESGMREIERRLEAGEDIEEIAAEEVVGDGGKDESDAEIIGYLTTIARGEVTPVDESVPSGPNRRELQGDLRDAAGLLLHLLKDDDRPGNL